MQYIKFISSTLIISFLAGCYTKTNPPEYTNVINKPRKLNKPIFIIDIGGVRPWEPNIRWLEKSSSPPCYTPKGSCVPSMKTYQKNPAIWNKWYGKFDYRQRIFAVIPAGTKYHISKITTPAGISDDSSHLYITIDSGKFQGMTLKIIRECYGE